MVAVGVPAAGLRGGWRDYCIVNAPERSGLGAFVVLRALASLLALVVAKRWDVGSRCDIRIAKGEQPA